MEVAHGFWNRPLITAGSFWVVLGGVLGAVAGSFLAALVVRWPAGGSVARDRSRCDSCGATLRVTELVPLISWALSNGRCRRCSARIDPRHPLMEAGGTLIGIVSLWASPGPDGLFGALFGWMLLALAVLDFEHFWLPDRLTLPLIAIGLACGLAPFSPTLTDRISGAVAGFVSLTVVAATYQRLRGKTGLGGGDPKMFAAIGAWLGWRSLPAVLLAAALAGLAIVLWRMLRGARYDPAARLPLGSLLGAVAWPLWVAQTIARG